MKFKSVRIKNFYNLEEVELDLTKGNALIVGPNGSGKSNIIKCINFLVNSVSTASSRNLLGDAVKIWNSNAAECFIQVDATLSKAEMEQFSTLRICHLLLQVCKVVTLVVAMLQKLAVNHWPRKNEGLLSPKEYEDWVKYIREKEVFKDLPRDTFDALFEIGSFASLRNGKVSLYVESDPRLPRRLPAWQMDPYFSHQVEQQSERRMECHSERSMEQRIHDIINELLPELLKITKDSIESGESRPKEGTDVEIKLEIGDTGSEINRYFSILDDVWLPVPTDKETQAVRTTLCNLFGELNGTDFFISEMDSSDQSSPGRNGEEKDETRRETSGVLFKEMIFQLVEKKHWHRTALKLSCLQKSITDQDVTATPLKIRPLFSMMTRNRGFSRWLSNCWQGPHQIHEFFHSESSFPSTAAKHFLKRSLCILQQNRGLLTEEDIVSLDVDKVERLLIQSCLSQKRKEREQFAEVADALRKFCSLDIHVCRKQINDYSRLVVRRRGPSRNYILIDQSDDDLPELFAEERWQQRQTPDWTKELQVLVTRTLRTNEAPYSIQTTLSDLSGGEVEILMCLCAIHLSGADTVILDEPGHSLHPPQQAQLRRWLETQRPEDQVCVVVTHSIEFITPLSLHCLYHMSFEASGFKPFRLRSLSEPESTAQDHSSQVTFTQETLTMLMRPDMRKMFFATGLYLVEGETDKRVFSAVRHKMMEEAREKKERMTSQTQSITVAEMDHWNILALQGCAEAVKAYKAAKQLKIPCAVVLDRDVLTAATNSVETEPLTKPNWEKSRLHKLLTNEKDSFDVASNLLQEMQGAFQDVSGAPREVFQKHGFWIWEGGNLEAAICDDRTARPKLLKIEGFVEDVGLSEHKKDECLEAMESQEAAQSNFRDNVIPEMSKILEEFQAKLSAVPDMIPQAPTENVTGELQQLIRQLESKRQLLVDHDQQFQKKNESSTMSEENQDEFWLAVKKKLHKGGWTRMRWDTLQEVVDTCLQSPTSPLSKFRDFMKDWQSKQR